MHTDNKSYLFDVCQITQKYYFLCHLLHPTLLYAVGREHSIKAWGKPKRDLSGIEAYEEFDEFMLKKNEISSDLHTCSNLMLLKKTCGKIMLLEYNFFFQERFQIHFVSITVKILSDSSQCKEITNRRVH